MRETVAFFTARSYGQVCVKEHPERNRGLFNINFAKSMGSVVNRQNSKDAV
jgi:hypothetical protein